MWSYATADKNFATLLLDHPEGKKVMKRLLMAIRRQDVAVEHGLFFQTMLDGYTPPTLYPFTSSLMSHIFQFEY